MLWKYFTIVVCTLVTGLFKIISVYYITTTSNRSDFHSLQNHNEARVDALSTLRDRLRWMNTVESILNDHLTEEVQQQPEKHTSSLAVYYNNQPWMCG